MYRLATMHSVTDGRTDGQTVRQTDNVSMPIVDHTACSMIGENISQFMKFEVNNYSFSWKMV